eukprot:3924354-Amphidinium_carterae.1
MGMQSQIVQFRLGLQFGVSCDPGLFLALVHRLHISQRLQNTGSKGALMLARVWQPGRCRRATL